MIEGFNHIGILVPDLDVALRLYSETLGLQASPVQILDDPPIQSLHPEAGQGTMIELVQQKSRLLGAYRRPL